MGDENGEIIQQKTVMFSNQSSLRLARSQIKVFDILHYPPKVSYTKACFKKKKTSLTNLQKQFSKKKTPGYDYLEKHGISNEGTHLPIKIEKIAAASTIFPYHSTSSLCKLCVYHSEIFLPQVFLQVNTKRFVNLCCSTPFHYWDFFL